MNKIAYLTIEFLGIATFHMELEVDTNNRLRMMEEILDHVEWFVTVRVPLSGFSIISWDYELLPMDYHELEPHFEGFEGTIYDHTYDYEVPIYV